MSAPEQIAIVGVGCRFPGADDVSEFWRVLSKGENHVIEVPKSRWNVDAFYDPDPSAPGKTYVRHAGFVNGIDEWDNQLFGVSQTEAELIDPQQRMVLDCVHMALEDGGITKTDIKGSKTGVFVGQMTFDYSSQVLDYDSTTSAYTVTGTNPSITSARVSYVYNLSGPAMTVDTACSSSLVAIDLGCDALRSGSCTAAICGGVNAMLNPQMFIAVSKARMLSPGGQCKTFTKDADGYARGEGCGIVILKRLSDAIRDGNKIWATVRTGSNQDGRCVTPITAPSSDRQYELLEQVFHQHHVDKSRVQVIEAHGTGTPIGDPTECKALGSFFGEPATKDIHIGSVKTNIGHLEAAAGVAGLIKVLLMMKHAQVVPSLWYTKENENPKLNLGRYRFIVPTDCKPWPVKGTNRRLASVNSFGFGGTNAHAIVEQYSENHSQNKTNGTHSYGTSVVPIVAISAFENEMLIKSVKKFCDHIEDRDYDLHELSHTSTCRRDHKPKRVAFGAATKAELLDQCKHFIFEKPVAVKHTSEDKNIVFVFCGVGTVWQGMCHWLLKHHVFRETIERIDSLLVPMSGWSIKDKLLADGSIGIDPMVDHIAIFACQVGLVEMWKEFGVKPDSVVGQSVGEVAAAWASGHIDLNYAVRVIYYRSKLLADVREGKMAVVRHTDVKLVDKYCKTQDNVSIAVYNSPVSCTVSGNAESLVKLEEYLSDVTKGQSKFTLLDVRCGYHSQYVADAAENIGKMIGSTGHTEKTVPIYSTVTGRLGTNDAYVSPSYWKRNVRSSVQFASAVRESRNTSKVNIYLEVGPSPVLHAHIDDICPDDDSVTTVPSIKRRLEAEGMARAICSLYEHRIDLKWDAISPRRGSITDVPKYNLHKVKGLFESARALQTAQDGGHSITALHPYINMLPYEDDNVAFQAEINDNNTPFVYDHIIHGKNILPGAFYADIGYVAAETILKCKQEHVSVSMEFLRPVNLVRSHDTSLHITTHKLDKVVEFHAQNRNTTVCRGIVQGVMATDDDIETMETNIEAIKLTVTMSPHREMGQDAIYDFLGTKGYIYGDYFRLMNHVVTNGSELIAEVETPTHIMKESESLRLHPCILDVMMQTTAMLVNERLLKEIREDGMTFLPAGLQKLRWYRKLERHMVIYTRRVSEMLLDTVYQLHFHILLLDQHGNRIAEIGNMMTYASRKGAHAPLELTYKLTWQPLQMQLETKHTLHKLPTILFLSDAPQTEMERLFGSNKNVTVFRERTVSCQDHVDSAFDTVIELTGATDRKFDAIVYYAKPIKMQVDLNSEDAQSLFGTISDNCVFLTELVKKMISVRLDIPLYVVTENTQPNFKYRTSPVNVVGSEIWGFARSIHYEMLYSGLTLIDIQPSLKGTKSRLLEFIDRTCQNIAEFPTEIILHEDSVWYSRFDKMDRCKQVQLAQEMTSCPRPIHGLHNLVQSDSSSRSLDGVCLSPVSTLPNSITSISPTVRIQVKAVTKPPANILQHTQPLRPTQNDADNQLLTPWLPVFAVEFTGYMLQGKRKPKVSCGGNIECETMNDDTARWEHIVVWPTNIQSEMLVPKSLVFNMKDIPFYQPGLLLYSLLFWSMVELVPRNASVVLYGHDPHGIAYRLLQRMLLDIKQVSVCSLEDTYTTTREIDVFVTMEPVTDRHDMLWSSRRIVCLPGHLSQEATAALQSTRTSISTLNTHDAISEKNIKKTLPRIVKWLKHNQKQVVAIMKSQRNGIQEKNGVIQIPCNTVDITDGSGHSCLPTRKPLQQMFRKSEAYVVTGGLTGLGWELTMRMAELGAGIIATVTRSTPTQNMMENIEKLQSKSGCRIVCLQADVKDIFAVRKAFTELMLITGNTPIKGIFHGAGVLKDKLLIDVTRSDIEFVLEPKVLGTLNLHVVCRELDLPLDYFVVASSVNSIIGSPGQSSYGAANTFMDTFMTWRRDHGLAGQSINWGALAVGMAANPKFVKSFVEKGFNMVQTPEITCCFQQALLQNDTCVVYADINWDLVAKYFRVPLLKRILLQFITIISEAASTVALVQEQENEYADFDVEVLCKADHGKQIEKLTSICLKVATKVIGGNTELIDVNDSLAQLSFDSMSTITFTNVLQQITSYRIPAVFLLDSSRTLNDIVEHLHQHLFMVEVAHL